MSVSCLTSLLPHVCPIQAINESADKNSARHAQFQEKEKTPTSELNKFLFNVFFSTEITIIKIIAFPGFVASRVSSKHTIFQY